MGESNYFSKSPRSMRGVPMLLPQLRNERRGPTVERILLHYSQEMVVLCGTAAPVLLPVLLSRDLGLLSSVAIESLYGCP